MAGKRFVPWIQKHRAWLKVAKHRAAGVKAPIHEPERTAALRRMTKHIPDDDDGFWQQKIWTDPAIYPGYLNLPDIAGLDMALLEWGLYAVRANL